MMVMRRLTLLSVTMLAAPLGAVGHAQAEELPPVPIITQVAADAGVLTTEDLQALRVEYTVNMQRVKEAQSPPRQVRESQVSVPMAMFPRLVT